MEGLPAWLDAPKIAGLSVLQMGFVQYFKEYIPEKWIKLFAIGMGIVLSIAMEIYIGSAFTGHTDWIKAIVNGMVAVVIGHLGYSFLSTKPTSFSLPSKTQVESKAEEFMPQTKKDQPGK